MAVEEIPRDSGVLQRQGGSWFTAENATGRNGSEGQADDFFKAHDDQFIFSAGNARLMRRLSCSLVTRRLSHEHPGNASFFACVRPCRLFQ